MNKARSYFTYRERQTIKDILRVLRRLGAVNKDLEDDTVDAMYHDWLDWFGELEA